MNAAARRRGIRWTRVQKASAAVSAGFLVLGLLGFVPGSTTGIENLSVAGSSSGAFLAGLVQVSVLHNAVNLLLGAAGIAAARTDAGARGFLVVGAAFNLFLAAYGAFIRNDSILNVLPLNDAGTWLHLISCTFMAALFLLLCRVSWNAE